MEIAIKKLKGSDPREVEREFESLSKLKHKNIVTVYGIYIDTVDIHILLEYAECGSVYNFLHKLDNEISYIGKINWMRQCAEVCCVLIIYTEINSFPIFICYRHWRTCTRKI